jgi:hypothetical protein
LDLIERHAAEAAVSDHHVTIYHDIGDRARR